MCTYWLQERLTSAPYLRRYKCCTVFWSGKIILLHLKKLNFPVHTMKAYEGMGMCLHAFLTSVPFWCEWSASCPGHYLHGKSAQYVLNRMLGDSSATLAILEKRKISCLMPEFNCDYWIFLLIACPLYQVHYCKREVMLIESNSLEFYTNCLFCMKVMTVLLKKLTRFLVFQ
jgi:hypothetical protein